MRCLRWRREEGGGRREISVISIGGTRAEGGRRRSYLDGVGWGRGFWAVPDDAALRLPSRLRPTSAHRVEGCELDVPLVGKIPGVQRASGGGRRGPRETLAIFIASTRQDTITNDVGCGRCNAWCVCVWAGGGGGGGVGGRGERGGGEGGGERGGRGRGGRERGGGEVSLCQASSRLAR